MHKATAWIVTATFVLGIGASALAQGTTTTPPAGGTSAPAGSTPAPAPSASKPAKTAAKKPAVKSVSGMVKSAAPDSLVLVDKKDKEWTFTLDKATKIRKANKTAEPKDLAEKDAATVSYTEADGKMHATAVTVKPPPAAKKKTS
ncbi:MAG TPA: hypothetical protein VFC42_02475 [Methylomirabilota bacterium]|jgi:hypothetical protein|nr:hypothetical protein [Methylomirabilota bacterium]